MSTFKYNEMNIHYTQTGKGKSLLFLHGWGADATTFKGLTDTLANHYEVTALDFPGFGLSDEPKTPWSTREYAEMTQAFIEDLGLDTPVLIGHSFGGRVAILLNTMREVNTMVLIGSAGIKPKRQLDYYLKVYGYKLFKQLAKWPLLSFILKEPLQAYHEKYASSDFKQATPMMKQILSKVVNDDLVKILPSIKASTLLIWGDEDTSTPLSDAKRMASMIPDAGLVVYKGVGHFAYIEEQERTLTIIRTFLGGQV